MDLAVDLSDRSDRATAIYRALLDAIRGGRLVPGDRLPPTRTLARDLGVSRTTVGTAYERLVAEGFLHARVGDGTYVADAAARPVPRGPRTALRPRAGWTFSAHRVSGSVADPLYDFRAGLLAPSLFAFDTRRRLVATDPEDVLVTHGTQQALGPAGPGAAGAG